MNKGQSFRFRIVESFKNLSIMKTAIVFLLVVALIAITIDAANPKEEHVNSRMKKGAPIEDSM